MNPLLIFALGNVLAFVGWRLFATYHGKTVSAGVTPLGSRERIVSMMGGILEKRTRIVFGDGRSGIFVERDNPKTGVSFSLKFGIAVGWSSYPKNKSEANQWLSSWNTARRSATNGAGVEGALKNCANRKHAVDVLEQYDLQLARHLIGKTDWGLTSQ